MEKFISVGIDVAKDKLDMAVRPLKTWDTIPYDEDGINSIIKVLCKLKPNIITVEATGGTGKQINYCFIRGILTCSSR